jgi:Ca2+-binding EF-hand superfamily protein
MDNPVVRFDLPLCESEDGTVFFGHDPSKLWQATQRAFDAIDRIDALINRSARRRSTLPAGYMTKQRSAELAEIFKIFDKSGDGFLEIDELTTVLASTGYRYNNEQIQEVVDHVTGRKGSSGLTFLQFANLLRINLNSSFEARIRQRFNMFDADQSGEVTLEEFTACVQGLDGLITTAEAAAMFQKCDHDKNGSVSLHEFMRVMEQTYNSLSADSNMLTISPKVEARRSDMFSAPVFNTSIWESKQEVIKVQALEVLDDDDDDDAEADTRCCFVTASHPRLRMTRLSSRLKLVLKSAQKALVSAVTPHVGYYELWSHLRRLQP